MRTIHRLLVAAAFAALVASCGDRSPRADGPRKLRIGHFPNVTHAQALVARATAREGRGFFEARMGPGVALEWYTFNAGPSAIEALLAGSLDLAYVGPSPAVNAYVKSKGDEIRVLAGAARGGSALVVQGDGRIAKPEDLRGKKVVTPQLGNTQDVACRAWLADRGFHVTRSGGDVSVLPTPNAAVVGLFLNHDVDAAWAVEPLVSVLEVEAHGKVLVEDKDSVTTVLVASAKFVRDEPDLARRAAKAHDELTAWIVAHPGEAKALVGAESLVETGRVLSADELARSWGRLTFDASIDVGAFAKFVAAAKAAGFLTEEVDLSRLVDARR